MPCEFWVPSQVLSLSVPPVGQPYVRVGKECRLPTVVFIPISGTCRFSFADLFMCLVGIKEAETEAGPLPFLHSMWPSGISFQFS